MYVHPELKDVLAALPAREATTDVQAIRDGFRALMAPRMTPDPRVTVEETTIPGPDGNELPVQVIRPAGASGDEWPVGVLYIHGGGFAYGELDGPSPMARDVCAATGAVVVNVHYRLAPEHPFPAGPEDCYAALCWLARRAGRVAVVGASAGGALSAAMTLMARDRKGPEIAFQCLLIPTVDDRGETASRREITDARVTNRAGIERAWRYYVGDDRSSVSPYAAPARAGDLSGLPPAYVLTCGMDPLRDEGIDYARRLVEADVPVQTHHVPGAWHLFEAYAPDSSLARATTEHWLTALTAVLHE